MVRILPAVLVAEDDSSAVGAGHGGHQVPEAGEAVAEAVAQQRRVSRRRLVDEALADVDVSRRDGVTAFRRREDDVDGVGGVADPGVLAIVKWETLSGLKFTFTVKVCSIDLLSPGSAATSNILQSLYNGALL